MRLIIFTNRDLASNLFLNHLLPHVSRDVVQIFLSDKVGKKTTITPPKALQELKFLEQTLPNEVLFPLLDSQNRQNTEWGKLLTFNELSRVIGTRIARITQIFTDFTLLGFLINFCQSK